MSPERRYKPRWTVTTHFEEQHIVVVLRDRGIYKSTTYSRKLPVTATWYRHTPWAKVQKTIDRYQRRADRLNKKQEIADFYKASLDRKIS